MIDIKLLKKLFRDNNINVSVNRGTRVPGFGNPTSGIALNVFGSSIMIRYTSRNFGSKETSDQNRNRLMDSVKSILNQYQIPFTIIDEGSALERFQISNPDDIPNPLETNAESSLDWDKDIIKKTSANDQPIIDINALKDYMLQVFPNLEIQSSSLYGLSNDVIVLSSKDLDFIISAGTIYPSDIPTYYNINFQTEIMTKAPVSLDSFEQKILTTTKTRGRYRKVNKAYTPDTLDQAKAIIDKIKVKYT